MNKDLIILCSMVSSAITEDPESVHFIHRAIVDGLREQEKKANNLRAESETAMKLMMSMLLNGKNKWAIDQMQKVFLESVAEKYKCNIAREFVEKLETKDA